MGGTFSKNRRDEKYTLYKLFVGQPEGLDISMEQY
jgi:hypothetical protein